MRNKCVLSVAQRPWPYELSESMTYVQEHSKS